MPNDFLPKTDQGLRAFAVNFSGLITLSPTSYGLTAPIATALAAKVTAYTTDLATAVDPSTRGPAAVLQKDISRAALVAEIRAVARAVQGAMTTTDPQRQALGLPIRDVEPTPIGIPGPLRLDIVSVEGRTVKIRLSDPANPTRRARPAGVAGASVFSYVGNAPPENISEWTFQGSVTRTEVEVVFETSVPAFAKVYLTAFWYNPRAQSGVACTPVATNLGTWNVMAAA